MDRKTAFVTNAREYAGAPAAAAFARSGWNVFCHDDSFTSPKERGDYEHQNPGQNAAQAKDMTTFVAEGIDRFGRIDVLISNDIPKVASAKGGRVTGKDVLEVGDLLDGFEAFVDSLLVEPIRLLRAALPCMRAARRGSIILVTSGSPLRAPSMAIAHGYSAARAAANSLAKSLAGELAPYNIQVNAVAPFLLYSQTMFPSDIGIDDPQFAPLVQQLVPMKRFGAPAELGALILHLTSGEMNFVSGQVIAFSGAAC
jgi:NAD(P)-dependent dehydrogenase (short-subunit alcohol dehydrogenase family)